MTDQLMAEEQAKLARTVAFIDAEIVRLRDSRPQTAAYTAAAQEQQRIIDEKLERFEDARSQPFFGRVDFAGSGDVTVGYIGKHLIRDHVLSWTSPFAQLYYVGPDELSSIDTPEGPLRGQVVLKRSYEIVEARLLKVAEQFRLARPGEQASAATADPLVGRLSQSRDGHLRETIATLQPKQYEQIAATAEGVLLVQGVAGSGKSIVGLHRVAFLLSPLNGRATRPTASRVAFFGPSRTFLNYVGKLLPSLDVKDVAQKTIAEWLLSTLSRKVQVDDRDSLFERLLRQSAQQAEATARAAKIKGSLDFAATLDRYVQSRGEAFVAAAGAVSVETPGGATLIEAAHVRSMAAALRHLPLNRQRERLIGQLVEAAAKRVSTPDGDGHRSLSREFRWLARASVERQVQAFWPRLDFAREYRRLLSDPTELDRASRGWLRDDAHMLAASLPRSLARFHHEDLAALCYLDRLLNERPSAGFEHVVLDEAQEVSPLEVLVLRLHSRGDSFTILGDLAQNLSPTGVDDWKDLLKPLGGAAVSQHTARSSLRATAELTRFANAVLKVARPRSKSAVPIQRHGPRPAFRRSASYADMVTAIADDIRMLRAEGSKTIGVACKTALEARRLHAELRRAGVEHIALLDLRDEASDSTVIGPSYLMRGLEFDAVILAGAHSTVYTGTPLHNKLLYLAVTRAAHRLHIHWIKTLAKALGPTPSKPRARKKSRPARAS